VAAGILADATWRIVVRGSAWRAAICTSVCTALWRRERRLEPRLDSVAATGP
jgi:hypothetical protein